MSMELDWGRAVAVGDFDADGDQDFAVGNGFGSRGRNRIYRNDAGTFVVHWTAPAAAYSQGVAWSDVDRDGDLDLVAAVDVGARLYRNDAGAFSSGDAIDTGPDAPTDIALADFDRDGDDDVAISTANGVRVYSNNGTGIFQRSWEAPLVYTASVAWGDYDRDGDLDLLVGGGRDLLVYARDGGSFATAFSSAMDLQPPVVYSTPGAAWIDFDGDGDLDIAASHCDPPVNGACMPAPQRLYRNTGGTFSIAWTSTETGVGSSVAVADFDSDGDPDLVFGSTGVNRVYKNAGGAMQLYWSSTEGEITNAVSWIPLGPRE
jgi:hypothetical protein